MVKAHTSVLVYKSTRKTKYNKKWEACKYSQNKRHVEGDSMSKNIILNSVSDSFISSVSDFNVARYEISRLYGIRRKEEEKANEIEKSVRENRQKAIEGGMSLDDAISRYPMTEADSIRIKAKADFETAAEPFQKMKREAFQSVPDSVYYAYALTIEKGMLDAKGILRIQKGKSVEERKVDRSFKSEIREFLVSIGAGMTDNETALNKCAEALRTWTAGAVNDNKSDSQLLKAKGKNLFREQFLRAFIQYGVSRNYLVVNADHTVTVREFKTEEKAEKKSA